MSFANRAAQEHAIKQEFADAVRDGAYALAWRIAHANPDLIGRADTEELPEEEE